MNELTMTREQFERHLPRIYPGLTHLLDGTEYLIVVGPDLGGMHAPTYITNLRADNTDDLIQQLRLLLQDLESRKIT